MLDANRSTVDAGQTGEQKNQPRSGLAANFERRPLAPLGFSTKRAIWGAPASGDLEPMHPGEPSTATRIGVLQRNGHRCMFCGLVSMVNEVHSRNDNHHDLQSENLDVADPICHRWQHLGELGAGNGIIVYLPGLSTTDVSHLFRTILIALRGSDAVTRADAQRLLNWLASHRQYVEEAWGTSDPADFAAAIRHTVQEDPSRLASAFEHLALVINPVLLEAATRRWIEEAATRWPLDAWPRVHHDVLNAPT